MAIESRRRYQAGTVGRAEYREPSRPAGIASDVGVPLLQAAVSAVAVALAIVAWAGIDAWRAAGLAGLTVGVLMWAWFLSQHRDALWLRELVENQPERPTTDTRPRTVINAVINGTVTARTELDMWPDQLRRIAKATLDYNRPFSAREWSGRGGLLSREQFEQMRDAFLARGWMTWKDENHRRLGVEWAPAGLDALRAILAAADEQDTD